MLTDFVYRYTSQPLGFTSVPVSIKKPEVATILPMSKRDQQQKTQQQEQHVGSNYCYEEAEAMK